VLELEPGEVLKREVE